MLVPVSALRGSAKRELGAGTARSGGKKPHLDFSACDGIASSLLPPPMLESFVTISDVCDGVASSLLPPPMPESFVTITKAERSAFLAKSQAFLTVCYSRYDSALFG